VLEERDAGSSLASTQYVWDPLAVDTLVERDQDTNGNGTLNERLYIQQDANSNVSALVNTTGNVVERYVYSPFGSVTVLTPTWGAWGSSAYAMSYLFQGGRYDDAIGDYRFGAREYRPTIEVWTSQDPLGYQAGPNLYQFVGDNPTLATDPTGKDVYLETYGSSSNPGEQSSDSLCSPSNAYHQRICVDTWNAQGAFSGRRCFSFRGTGYRWPTFSSTWLGHDSCQCGCILSGKKCTTSSWTRMCMPMPSARVRSWSWIERNSVVPWSQFGLFSCPSPELHRKIDAILFERYTDDIERRVTVVKLMRFCLVLCAVLALSSRSRAGSIVGTLDGSQEVPPNLVTQATGTFLGDLQLSGATATLNFTLTYTNLIGGAVVAAGFYDAPAGSAGPNVRTYDPGLFSSPDGTFMGSWTSSDSQPLTPALVSEVLAGNIYFEIGTQEFPGSPGEIRGQLSAVVPEPRTFWLLLGAPGLALACRRAGRS